jgi:hypothetical protein
MTPLRISFEYNSHQTLSDCVKELINSSYKIYEEIIKSNIPTTLVCGGQSPAYFCLAMMNFDIYNPNKCNIIILPHSKGGQKSTDQNKENKLYCQRLKEKNFTFKPNVIILDGVHTGTGINALSSAIQYYDYKLKIHKYAINTDYYISQIPVAKTYIVKSEPLFSDTFPRIVNSFKSYEFDEPYKFITQFINIADNPIANMIIDISKIYQKSNLDDNLWIKLNHNVTKEITENKKIFDVNQRKLSIQNSYRKIKFKPNIKFNSDNCKVYECPDCLTISGTSAVENPYNTSLFSHNLYCKYKYAIPCE